MPDGEVQKIIYETVLFGFACLLAFVLYFGITKKDPKSK